MSHFFFPGAALADRFGAPPRHPAMNLVDRTATTSPALARVHIAPRLYTPGPETTPFFAHFSHDGKVLVLETPTTQETYSAAPAECADRSVSTNP